MNKKPTLFIKRLHPLAVIPKYNHPGEDAAFDLHTVIDFELKEGDALKVPVGIAVEFPAGYFAHVMGRSGLATLGVVILGGVIDSGYRGEWHVQMTMMKGNYIFRAGDKIAQCAIIPVPQFSIVEVDTLTPSKRGENGFGSSDKKSEEETESYITTRTTITYRR